MSFSREGVSNPSCLPGLCRCTAGAVYELQRLLRTCDRLGLRVLIDMHGAAFTPPPSFCCSRWVARLVHRCPSLTKRLRQLWPCCQRDLGGRWAVVYPLADPQCGVAGVVRPFYDDVLGDQLEQYTDDRAGKLGDGWGVAEVCLGEWARAIAPRLHLMLTQVLQQIATTLQSFNAVLGLEALNEPWQYTPLDVLKAFYWDAYWAVRAAAPHWLFVIQVSPFEPYSEPRNLARSSRVPAR